MKPNHTTAGGLRVYAHGVSKVDPDFMVIEHEGSHVKLYMATGLTPYDPAAGLKLNDIVYIASNAGARPVFFFLAQEHGQISYRETKNGTAFITSDWSLEP